MCLLLGQLPPLLWPQGNLAIMACHPPSKALPLPGPLQLAQQKHEALCRVGSSTGSTMNCHPIW